MPAPDSQNPFQFQHADLHAKYILSLIVEMIEPYQGRVYDPAMGSGGFFVQSERFIEEHGGTIGDIMVFGQESNPTTWRLAAMNMAIRGIDFDFGKEPADTFTRDQHPDLHRPTDRGNPSALPQPHPRSRVRLRRHVHPVLPLTSEKSHRERK